MKNILIQFRCSCDSIRVATLEGKCAELELDKRFYEWIKNADIPPMLPVYREPLGNVLLATDDCENPGSSWYVIVNVVEFTEQDAASYRHTNEASTPVPWAVFKEIAKKRAGVS